MAKTKTSHGAPTKDQQKPGLADHEGAAALLGVQDVLLTTEQLAPRLGFSVRKVRQYARSGKLPAVRLNRRDIRFHWPTVLSRLTGA